MSGHSTASLGARHPIHNWQYADLTEREAATGFVTSDVYKIALQLDDLSYWVLTATTPTWVQVGSSTATLASLGGMINARSPKTGAYTVVAGDKGTVIEATTGTWTLSLTAAASLGNAFACVVANSGSGTITIDANGAETILDASGSATTKTLTQGESGILVCDGTGWFLYKISAGGGSLASLGGLINARQAKTGAYTVVSGDKGTVIEATSGTWTLSLTASASLGAGFACVFLNSGSGTITIDPDSTETIRDATGSATTNTVLQGEGGFLICDGTGWFFIKTSVAASAPTLASLGGFINARSAKTGAYTVISTDKGAFIEATSGTWTLSLTAVASLGAGFAFSFFNSGSGTITIDPASTETIRDAAGSATTKTCAQGEGGILVSDGSAGWLFLKSVADTTGSGGTSLTINSQSADYTFVLGDAGACIYHPSSDTTARTFTIPANGSVAYATGTVIMIDNDASAGALTIAITTDTLVMVGTGSTGSRTLLSGGQATLLKVSSTRWRISGQGLS